MELQNVLAVGLVVLLGALAVFATFAPPVGHRLHDRAHPLTAQADARAEANADARAGTDSITEGDLRPAALDRVLRVGTWLFLFVVAAVVAATNLWADRAALIVVLLAIASVYVFIVHELLPGGRPDPLVLTSEGVLGLLFAGLLVGMTGGALSPFTAVFAMLVAGASVVVSERTTVVVAASAGIAYLAAVAIGGPNPLTPLAVALVAVNLAVVFLVGYVGMALAAEHRRARHEVIRRATEDDLTGLRTRRSVFAALERELGRSERTGRAFCVLMIDLDDLKGINDRHGHRAGDAALRTAGEVIRSRIRKIDTGARFGGDEFVVLLPETDPTGGWVVAEQIRQGIAEASLVLDGAPVPTTVSVGIVSYPHDGVAVNGLLEQADEAMYRSKRGGRDRVSGAPRGADARGESMPFHVGGALPAGRGTGGSDEPV